MTDAMDLINVLTKTTAYSEPPTDLHHSIITRVFAEVIRQYVKIGGQVLDIGAGDGFALQMFEREGCQAVGLNLVAEDVAACEAKGLLCCQGDMHRLNWLNKQFDFAWMRHVLEHSPFPMLALAEAHRVLKEAGMLYVEVPMPGTACQHETNPNHWALFSQVGWAQMFVRSGFEIVEQRQLNFTTQAGEDVYSCWLMRKPQTVYVVGNVIEETERTRLKLGQEYLP